MKKNTRLLTILLVAVMAVFALTACGGSNSVAGKTYDFESLTVNDQDATELMKSLYVESYYTFNDDGTCLSYTKFSADLAAAAGREDMEYEGTYEEDGDKVTAHFDAGPYADIEFTVDGEQLVIDAEDGTQVYKQR